jgi:hypothetical protein
MAGCTYNGLAPDTDPLYSSGWTIIHGKNLNPHYVEKLRRQSAREAKHGGPAPVKPEPKPPRKA